jgi:hypothetical protein
MTSRTVLLLRAAALTVALAVFPSSIAAAQTPASPQPTPETPRLEIAAVIGGASLDYSPVEWSHYLAALTARFPVTPRLAVEGEVAYLRGFCGATCWPSDHRDLVSSIALAYDLRSGQPPVLPYVVLGAGLMDSSEFGRGFVGVVGFGARIAITRHLFVSPDLRGIATSHGHVRTSVAVGWRF